MKCENCGKRIGLLSSGEKITSENSDFILCTECGKLLYNMRYDAKNNLKKEYEVDVKKFRDRNKGNSEILKKWMQKFNESISDDVQKAVKK